MAVSTKAPLLIRLMSASVTASLRAGNTIREILKTGDLRIKDKGIDDLQTEADRSAQRCIIGSLQHHFPKVTFVGEEIIVWVDPLDGTKEFTQGLLDHVTVLIGISVNGSAVAGVVYQPYFNYQSKISSEMGRCVYGVVGIGTFGLDPKPAPANENIITTTRSHSDPKVTAAVNACKPTEVIKVGGAGHKVLLVCEGTAHAYVFASKGCKKWDTCGPEAVLRALGGNLTDLHGNPIQYQLNVPRPNLSGVVATLSNHSWYINKIPDDVKAAFPAIS
ncbi:3'(2'),5'-bisphosphate nucleotidase 1 isoform X2 [Octopus bimaculoides]|uniref:3'(2'),5'-bisphosphate nucleotidase 1 isoform X2 n=1 Tax=Octopus bimaculoides TaxID=37653 RepID=UPI0022E185D6|nr:3'(2'),5'-bisphosphate nucleotidase 1 isoform X2 [Octopus bimaculoides]